VTKDLLTSRRHSNNLPRFHPVQLTQPRLIPAVRMMPDTFVRRSFLMWSKGLILYVCPLTGTALALAMAGQSSGENSNLATEAPLDHDSQTKPSNAWAVYKNLALKQAPANPDAYVLKVDPCGRFVCSF
jgi:hypothetical protein